MNKCNYPKLKKDFEEIMRNYLLQVSSFTSQKFSSKQHVIPARTRYFRGPGFAMLHENFNPKSDAEASNLLEGCTRVFLINPMLNKLFEHLNIACDWRYGNTFAKFTCSNREYENDAYLEFIIEEDHKKIGYRYTPLCYSESEQELMKRDWDYLYNHKAIPGFDKFCTIDEVWAIDWSGIKPEELASFQVTLSKKDKSHAITAQEFLLRYFTQEEYEEFVSLLKNAMGQAHQFIGLKTIPLLSPNSLLAFKDIVLLDFDEQSVQKLAYRFSNPLSVPTPLLSHDDTKEINKMFFGCEYRNAIKGHSDFAKSFITSEYLFRTISPDLVIDYTAVVVGYLKSVEQLLYLIYTSAFNGRKGMYYWDSERNYNSYCSSLRKRNRPIPQMRPEDKEPNPYSTGENRYKYYHKKRTGDKAPEFGDLIWFLRHNQEFWGAALWNVSDSGKDYIFSCLDDYRNYCRNQHFHKDNIWSANYQVVLQIRNNTFVCLYYLLGALNLLDKSVSKQAQLGIESYSFNYLYQEVFHHRKRFFWAKVQDGYEGIIYYLGNDNTAQYDADSRLINIELHFAKIPGYTPHTLSRSKIEELIADGNFISSNLFTVSSTANLTSFSAIHISKK